MSRRKKSESRQTLKASSCVHLCSQGHASLYSKPTQLSQDPLIVLFLPHLRTISPSERHFLCELALSARTTKANQLILLLEGALPSAKDSESLWLEWSHTEREGIDQEQSGLACMGKFPGGHRHLILKVSINHSLSCPLTKVILFELTFLEAWLCACQPPLPPGNLLGRELLPSAQLPSCSDTWRPSSTATAHLNIMGRYQTPSNLQSSSCLVKRALKNYLKP